MPQNDTHDREERDEYKGFGDVLIARGVLDAGQLDEARALSSSSGQDLVEVIVERGIAPRQAVMSAMSQYLGIPYRSLVLDDIDPQAVKRIPRSMAYESRVIPVSIEEQALVLAACRPLDVQAQENLSFASGLSPAFTLCDWPDIRAALDQFFRRRPRPTSLSPTRSSPASSGSRGAGWRRRSASTRRSTTRRLPDYWTG